MTPTQKFLVIWLLVGLVTEILYRLWLKDRPTDRPLEYVMASLLGFITLLIAVITLFKYWRGKQ